MNILILIRDVVRLVGIVVGLAAPVTENEAAITPTVFMREMTGAPPVRLIDIAVGHVARLTDIAIDPAVPVTEIEIPLPNEAAITPTVSTRGMKGAPTRIGGKKKGAPRNTIG